MSRVPLALAAAALAGSAVSPAAAAPPLAASWSGTATVAQCDTWVCLEAVSDTCVATGAGGVTTACSATLSGRWDGACDGVGTGQLVVTGPDGEQWLNAILVASGGTVTWVARYAFLFDRTAVVASGVVDGGCAGGTWHGAYGGRGL
ncbi:MAG TPA: hypothetical protein VF519_00970 [Mycobacteriales bacterium]|jgi:hypothetical protein